MPKLIYATPKYRKHRATGQAVVTIGGKDQYLGPHRSKASLLEYERVISEWLANGRQASANEEGLLTVSEVLARYWKYARQHYRGKDGKPTSSVQEVKQTLRPLRRLYGHTLARDFGPLAVKAIRQVMIEEGLCRETINKRVGTIKRVFRWAVSEELVPPELHHGLSAVAGLQMGRTDAPESDAVEPISEADVQATLPHLPGIVVDMVRFQRLTGCRPGDVCIIRPCDVDRSNDVWEYRPKSHKTAYRGKERIIYVGLKAQDVLRPYLLREAEAYCFSPAESVKELRERKHARRRTPLSCGNRPGTNRTRNPKRAPGNRYDTDSYRRAIHRACKRAEVEKWSPNRLRHSAATEIRKKFGLEATQTVLGHAQADVTQIYAERDAELARDVMRKIG